MKLTNFHVITNFKSEVMNIIRPDIGDDPASCDFETSKCGYVDSTDNTSFTWTRHQGPTYSFNTGPSVDHTTGTDKGSLSLLSILYFLP